MRKDLYIIVLAALILMSTTVVKASNEVYYTNMNNIEMTESEYHNLLELGFTERQIARMSEQTFLDNKDIEATLLSEATKYVRYTTIMRNGIKTRIVEDITKEEAENEIALQSQNPPTRGPVGTYYDGVYDSGIIEIVNKISGISNTYMRYKTDADWYGGIPTDRYNDIIATGIEYQKVQIASPIIFDEDWVTTNNTFGYSESCYPKTQSTGGSAIFELPSGSLTSITASIYFNVRKQDNVGTITELHSCGNYAHADTYVDPAVLFNNYTVGLSYGISIDPVYSNYYTYSTPACAAFYGTW